MPDAENTDTASRASREQSELWRFEWGGGRARSAWWFERCRPKRILATTALLCVEVERVDESWTAEYQDSLRDELRKLARGVAHTAWDCGLQRPVILAFVETDEAIREWLTKLAAEQEWHRGEFTLWPFGSREGLTWLPWPNVKALQQSDADRLSPKEDDLRVEAFAKKQTDGLGRLVREFWDQIKTLREPGEANELTDQEKQSFNAPIDRWIDSALQKARAVARRPKPAPIKLAVPLVLKSYEPAGEGELDFPADASEAARRAWHPDSVEKLQLLRSWVNLQHPPVLEVVPKCTPAVAMYVGSMFHAATGITLRVTQHNQRTNETGFWQRTPGRAVDPARLEVAWRSMDNDLEEICALISVTQDVVSDANLWMSQHPAARAVVQLSLPELSATVVKDGNEAYAIALAVRQALVRARRELGLPKTVPLRLFYAGPVALAMFIGAELNAMGEVFLMDFHKDTSSYVESFHLRPGG